MSDIKFFGQSQLRLIVIVLTSGREYGDSKERPNKGDKCAQIDTISSMAFIQQTSERITGHYHT